MLEFDTSTRAGYETGLFEILYAASTNVVAQALSKTRTGRGRSI